MRLRWSLFLIFVFLCLSRPVHAQLWSGILNPTYGTGACSFGQVTSPAQCAIDWTQVGIPGGIPTTWTQSGSTIAASTCGNGSSDCTSTIQSALNSCAGSSLPGKYVLLGPGTFLISGSLQVKNYCYLTGSGPQSTILNLMGTSGAGVSLGVYLDAPYKNGTGTITSGATAGSTSMTISAASIGPYSTGLGLGVGGYLVISEANDPVYVSSPSPENPGGCGYCDVNWSGTREREQIVEMTSVSGTGPYTVGFNPPLYTNYGVATGTSPAYATPFGAVDGGVADCKYCGLENLQVYSNGTRLSAGGPDLAMAVCAYCWVENVEANYTDADWLDMAFCFRCEVRNNYFSNAFGHGAGGSDADVSVYQETTASLIINNIFERGHSSVIVDLGAAGNVIAYNYSNGSYDAVGIGGNQLDFVEHGAYPQFNLFEGNIGPNWQPDSWHGNEGYNTVFRNWWRGANTVATYPPQAIKSIACSSGTCTITWATPPSTFYAGTYVNIYGTNQVACGSGSGLGLGSVNFQLTGSAGSLSSTFSGGGCTGATGGYAATLDLVSNPIPITHQPAEWSSSTFNTYQTMWAVTIPAFSVGNNLIGNILGSTQQSTVAGTGYLYDSGSGTCTSCLRAPTSRPYVGVGTAGGFGAASTYNYDTSGDSTGADWATFAGGPSSGNGYWSNQGFTTTCYSSNFDAASGKTINSVNCSPSTTLPASFFLSSRPAFWLKGIPWPAIGPDVSGGSDTAVAGHANLIPAAVCYNSTPRDSLGILQFDANNCYPAPPTNPNATPH